MNSISARSHYWKYWLDQEQLSAFPSLSATTPVLQGQGEHVSYLILSHYQCMVTGNPSSVYSSGGTLAPRERHGDKVLWWHGVDVGIGQLSRHKLSSHVPILAVVGKMWSPSGPITAQLRVPALWLAAGAGRRAAAAINTGAAPREPQSPPGSGGGNTVHNVNIPTYTRPPPVQYQYSITKTQGWVQSSQHYASLVEDASH